MINVGIVGVGMVADIHCRALGELKDIARISGVYSRNRERLEQFCEPRSLTPAASLEALVNDPGTDVILLLTPPNARRDIVAAAASAGKHVLMEKPVERTLSAANELVAIARDAGVTLGVVFQHRFREASIKLREMIADGRFGNLAGAMAEIPWWRPQSYYDEPGRGTYARDGGGVLINQAIHTMDLLLSYTGAVSDVSALAGTTALHRMEAEDFVSAGLRFSSGALGSIVATTAAYPGSAESIALHFEQASARLQSGTLTVSWHDGRVETFGETSGTGGGADPMAFPHDWHASVMCDFLTAIKDGREPAVTGAEALKVHELIDAITRSSAEGRVVKLEGAGR